MWFRAKVPLIEFSQGSPPPGMEPASMPNSYIMFAVPTLQVAKLEEK